MTVHSKLNAEIVFHEQERLAYRAQRSGRFGVPAAPTREVEPVAAVTIRLAHSGDAGAMAHLAELDGAGVPAAPQLIAELGGRAIAALSLSSHTVVADPFVATADIVVLLRLRAAQLLGGGGGRRRRFAAARGLARVRSLVAAR